MTYLLAQAVLAAPFAIAYRRRRRHAAEAAEWRANEAWLARIKHGS